MKKYKNLFCGFCMLFVFIQTIFAESPAKPLAVKITDIRLKGQPKLGQIITVEVDYTATVSGSVKFRINQPKYMVLVGQKSLEFTTNIVAGQQKTEQYQFAIQSAGSSLINVSVYLQDAPQNYIQGNSQYLTVEQDTVNYAVFSSITNDFLVKSAATQAEKFKQATKTDKSPIGTKGSSDKTFIISGKVTFFDEKHDKITKGLYGAKVYFWFRNSGNTNFLWHPSGEAESVTYSTIKPNGDFSFAWHGNVDYSGYNEIVLLVSPSNPSISYYTSTGYVVSTSQGTVTTFGNSEGAVLPFDNTLSYFYYPGTNIEVNSVDGGMIRNFKFASEFLNKRYNGNIPFGMGYSLDVWTAPLVQNNTAGVFISKSNGSKHIEIDPAYAELSTIAHEYGHFVTYQMWGGGTTGYNSMSNTSSQMKEGWAIFYSFATRNYANKVYGESLIDYDDNTETAPFDNPHFKNMRYANHGHPEYCAFGCYLWNLYDGYDDGIFKSNTYIGDNDDISGYGVRVFEVMRSMKEKNTLDYNNKFKDGLSAAIQNSVNSIYDNMFTNQAIKMRSAQVKNVNATLQSRDVINFSWQKNSYVGSFNPDYANRETGYRLYKRLTDNDSWSLFTTLPNTSSSYTAILTDAYKYKYQLTSYNSSGNSCGEIIISPRCGNFSTPFVELNNLTYYGNASIGACIINMKNVTVQNNVSVTFSADIETNIEGPFEVKENANVEIK